MDKGKGKVKDTREETKGKDKDKSCGKRLG